MPFIRMSRTGQTSYAVRRSRQPSPGATRLPAGQPGAAAAVALAAVALAAVALAAVALAAAARPAAVRPAAVRPAAARPVRPVQPRLLPDRSGRPSIPWAPLARATALEPINATRRVARLLEFAFRRAARPQTAAPSATPARSCLRRKGA